MPTYSYACTACDHTFDIRQSFTDDALTMCPKCGELRLRKVIHPVGISFKGSGFYRTDSKASGRSTTSGSSHSSHSSTDSSSDSSSSSSTKKDSSVATASSTTS